MKSVGEAKGMQRMGGFTLVELLMVVAIIALVATIGYGSYTGYIAKSHRQAAKNALHQIADRQEQFFQDNRSYADNLTDLGYAEDTMAIDDRGQLAPGSTSDVTYVLSFADASANAYTVQVEPRAVQATRDSDCGTLSLTHTGERDHSGDGDNCW